jgi:hypothetical protein
MTVSELIEALKDMPGGMRRIRRFYGIYKGIRALGYSIAQSLAGAYWLESHRKK